jgi:hypothetical protein
MLFTGEDIRRLDARALAAIDGVAILLNTLIVVYCGLVLLVIRKVCSKESDGLSFF